MIKLDVKRLRQGMLMGNAVLTKAVMICAAWYYGDKWDRQFKSGPWIMVTLLILAISFGLWFILFTAKRNQVNE